MRVITLCINWSIDAEWFYSSSCSFYIWTNRCSSFANNKGSYCKHSRQGEAELVMGVLVLVRSHKRPSAIGPSIALYT